MFSFPRQTQKCPADAGVRAPVWVQTADPAVTPSSKREVPPPETSAGLPQPGELRTWAHSSNSPLQSGPCVFQPL